MTCQCNQAREMDEYGQTYEGDFVEDFEALLNDMEGESDFESDYEGEGGTRYGDVVLAGESEYDQETPGQRYGDVFIQGEDTEYDPETEIFGPDTRVRVYSTKRPPCRYICNLEYDVPKIGRLSICSGTLIGPRTVLTAGHCLATLDPKRMRVIPGRNGTLEPFPATVASKFIPFPGFVGGTSTDLGIIHLADPVGKSVGYWTANFRKNPGDIIGTSILSGPLPMPAGKLKVNVQGYPGDMPPDKKHGCRDPKGPKNKCRGSLGGAKGRSRLCGTYQYRAFDVTVKLSGRILHYMNDTCPGHSGSPVWVRRPPGKGGRILVGVHIGADPTSNVAVFIDKTVRNWIVANTK